jgi:hypothetical protein
VGVVAARQFKLAKSAPTRWPAAASVITSRSPIALFDTIAGRERGLNRRQKQEPWALRRTALAVDDR